MMLKLPGLTIVGFLSVVVLSSPQLSAQGCSRGGGGGDMALGGGSGGGFGAPRLGGGGGFAAGGNPQVFAMAMQQLQRQNQLLQQQMLAMRQQMMLMQQQNQQLLAQLDRLRGDASESPIAAGSIAGLDGPRLTSRVASRPAAARQNKTPRNSRLTNNLAANAAVSPAVARNPGTDQRQ